MSMTSDATPVPPLAPDESIGLVALDWTPSGLRVARLSDIKTGGPVAPRPVAADVALVAEIATEPIVSAARVRPIAPSDPVAAALKGRVNVTRLCDVAPEQVSWLWPGYIARGKLTLLIGDPGCGKSYLTADIAARLTSGKPWPDGATGHSPMDVLLLQAEDGLSDTVRPRLDSLGADPGRVYAIEAVAPGPSGERWFSLDTDLARLEPVLATGRVGLLVVDPLTAYLGKPDSYKDQDVRQVLGPLAKLAAKHGVAIVAVMHLTKSEDRKALYRAGGSIAFTASARKVLVVVKDPDDPERRLLGSVKENIGGKPPTRAFRITELGMKWEDAEAHADIDDILSRPTGPQDEPKAPKLHSAMTFLKAELAGGPVLVAKLRAQVEAQGLNWKTVEKAKAALRVQTSAREGGGWLWALPGDLSSSSTPPPTPIARGGGIPSSSSAEEELPPWEEECRVAPQT
jgi:putative DNA primase/helicase